MSGASTTYGNLAHSLNNAVRQDHGIYSIKNYNFNKPIENITKESIKFSTYFEKYIEYCFDQYLRDNKCFLSPMQSNIVYYNFMRCSNERSPSYLLNLQFEDNYVSEDVNKLLFLKPNLILHETLDVLKAVKYL
jgi:hypothetical protein